MFNRYLKVIVVMVGLFFSTLIYASPITETIQNYKDIARTSQFFDTAYGYAVFPIVGAGGFIVGGSYGSGKVFKGDTMMGDATLASLSVGFQLGGKAFSEIIFFENKAAYDKFTSGSFAFSAKASAAVLTLGADAQVGTGGTTSSAGLGAIGAKTKPVASGNYADGMATFVVVKAGLMYKFAIDGQKFSYTPKPWM